VPSKCYDGEILKRDSTLEHQGLMCLRCSDDRSGKESPIEKTLSQLPAPDDRVKFNIR